MKKLRYVLLFLLLICLSAVCLIEPSMTAFASPLSGGGRAEEVAGAYEEDRNKVYIGGQIVGFTLDIDGVIILRFGAVSTEAGLATLKSDLREGDRIFSVDGERVRSSYELGEALNRDGSKTSFTFGVERSGETIEITVSPLIERVSGRLKIGAEVQEEISGLGTIVFTRHDGHFAALGHPVNSASGECAAITGGKVYGGKILGIEKGIRGKAGSIKGALVRNEKLGTALKNEKSGLYGVLDNPEGVLYDVGTRDEVVNGRAKIRSEVSGKTEFYDVEISRAGYSAGAEEKGLIVKVTDERLIALTGGIVQGMSGSPIVQNGKIVGAVTHVFVSDPLRGYGIYADMLKPD